MESIDKRVDKPSVTPFYDGNKLVNILDLDKEKPAICMICGNRSAGKTFWCKNFMIKQFKKTGRKFIILVRFGYQLTGMADTFFKDLQEVKFPESELTEGVLVKNSINELFLDGVSCGYCIALNNADSIKRNSTLFVDCDTLFLDEFQSETSKYCPNEVQKFISIYTSISRGGGKQNRYVRCLLASNNVTMINPYFYELNVSHRIQKDTKFLRGHGWVLEITFNENASEAIKTSGIGRAFANNKYMEYSTENVYLNDSDVFIEKPSGLCRLECVLEYEGINYGLWRFDSFLYISTKYDPKFRKKYALTIGDHKADITLLRKTDVMFRVYRECFDRGMFRFENLKCKELMFSLLGY